MKIEDGQDEQITSKLRNGHAADLQTQGHALAEIIDKVDRLHDKIARLPDRTEVRDMVERAITNHVMSCSSARKDDSNLFELGKNGLKAAGNKGVLVASLISAGIVFLIIKIAPFILSWIEATSK